MSKLYCVMVRETRYHHVHVEARNKEEVRQLRQEKLRECVERTPNMNYATEYDVHEVDIPTHWEDVVNWGIAHSTVTLGSRISDELDMTKKELE